MAPPRPEQVEGDRAASEQASQYLGPWRQTGRDRHGREFGLSGAGAATLSHIMSRDTRAWKGE